MSRAVFIAAALAVAAGLGGYAVGRYLPAVPMAAPDMKKETVAAVPAAPARAVLYYQHPDGTADYSPEPKKDERGRDYVAVLADPEPAPAPPAPAGGKILYYRNPMGLADTSPVPKKDSMGMDYVPVYEEEAGGAGILSVSLDKVQKLGVLTEPAMRRALTRTVRAVGAVAVDERRLYAVTPKVEGYIERLMVDQTGQTVTKGQSLMEVYSPDLALAQQDYRAAFQAARIQEQAGLDAYGQARALADAALARLRNWDVSAFAIERLRWGGAPSRTLPFVAPVSGVVLEKTAVQGMRFMPGDTLYRIADLSHVWVVADLFEQDLARIEVGQPADIAFDAFPGRRFTGTVSFIYPTLSPETRTARLRIDLPNPDGALKPSLYGAVRLATAAGASPEVTVPDSAVLDSGVQRTVLVERGEGRFEPRKVMTGERADGYVAILDGLDEGERVVVRANFLIDAESNLRAALQGFQTP